MQYVNFDLEIGPGKGRDYPIRVLQLPGGEIQATMHLPFGNTALKNSLSAFRLALLEWESISQAHAPEAQAVQALGQQLFEALITGSVRVCYEQLWRNISQQQDTTLRLRLSVLAPELVSVPWELLYDPHLPGYLSGTKRLSFVRTGTTAQPLSPLRVTSPLQILGIIASTLDPEEPAIKDAQDALHDILAPCLEHGQMKLTWQLGATRQEIEEAIRTGPWHAISLMDLGGCQWKGDEPSLALPGMAAATVQVTAEEFGHWLSLHPTLRLVTIQMGAGAQINDHAPGASIATHLAQQGIPAVLALPYHLERQTQNKLLTAFWGALADEGDVEKALSTARAAMHAGQQEGWESGGTVLYLQGAENRLFQITPKPALLAFASRHQRLFYLLAKRWVATLSSITGGIFLTTVLILAGLSGPPIPSPLLSFVEQHKTVSVLVGGTFVALSLWALWLARGPEPSVEARGSHGQFHQRLLLSNLLATGSTTLLILLLLLVVLRPSWCPTFLCPAPQVLTHGYHDTNLEISFTTFESPYYVLSDDPAHYSASTLPQSTLPQSIGAVRIDTSTPPPPYRVVLGIHSLQQGRFGLLIEQMALKITSVPPVPYPLNVWFKGAPLTYQSNPYQVVYSGQETGTLLPAAYLLSPYAHEQLAPGEADTVDIQVVSQLPVDLQFQVQITYRVTNESQFHTLLFPPVFAVVFSDASNWNAYLLQNEHLVPNP